MYEPDISNHLHDATSVVVVNAFFVHKPLNSLLTLLMRRFDREPFIEGGGRKTSGPSRSLDESSPGQFSLKPYIEPLSRWSR